MAGTVRSRRVHRDVEVVNILMDEYITNNPVLPSLKGRDFLTLSDYTPEEIRALLHLAAELKKQRDSQSARTLLQGKTLGMLFHKSSTRTRISFEVAITQLGGHAVVLNAAELQLGRGETIEDTARVLSRYVNGFMIRTFGHDEVETLAQHATIPIINGLTDSFHPCQVLADLQTIQERFATLSDVRVVYIGDGNNVAHSLAIGCALMGMDIVICTPPNFTMDHAVTEKVKQVCEQTNGTLHIVHDPEEAATDAHVLYTDVWVSMGQEEETERRRQQFLGFQIHKGLLERAHSDAIVMHCLPAQRGEEITADVLEGPQSVVFDQAENRLHAQKALLAALMRS